MDQGRGWSDSDPECVQCSTISPPSDGKLSSAVSNGTFTIATFQCNKGTTMKGGDMAVCLDTGNWSPPTPTCVKCADPPNLGTGSYAYISDGKITSLTVMCEVGSTVSGSVNGRCDTNGTWIFATSMSASCASCGAPPDPVGGSFKLMTNGTSTRGELMCNTGYVIQGGSASVLDCLSNGSWSQSSSSSAECVPLKSVAEASGSDRLLPALIALAVLCGVLVVAVGALVIKVVKWRTDKGVTKNGHAQVNGFPVSHAPFDHSQHVMDNRVVPPLFKTKTDLDSFRSKPDSTTTQTTSRMTTAVSSGNLLLHLIKETTSSSIYHDQPSPWNVVSFRGKEGTPSNDHSNHLGQEHDVDKKSKKHKKRSKRKLLQGTTSNDLGRTTPITSRTSPSVERTPRTVPVQSREHSSLGRPGQSTTPVLQHHIGSSAQHELNTTPRSGLIPTVH
ncbi:sushi, von Willebrand factor type A, EGF and pentraxin domain-containing protein 1-like [Dreissena polymorpha]|nr:sushi, von Willebrand factor type A, EGF and pentraxin domain-containing protein 1-like [Dreissena polymorpha]